MRSYIGVTGFMFAFEVREAVAAYREAWAEAGCEPTHDLMIGVLVSTKTLAGVQNKYPRRYPRIEDVAGMFSAEPGVLNLVHFAFDMADAVDNPGLLLRALDVGGARCQGIQLNTPTITDAYQHGWFKGDLEHLRKATSRVVLQLRPGDRTAERIAADACYCAGSGAVLGATDVLIDGSAGAGRALDVDRCGAIVDEIRHRAAWLGYGPRCIGVAGGLDAESVQQVGGFLGRGVNIDAEGRLRDDAPDGGDLDLGKVRAYLRASVLIAARERAEAS